MQEEWREIPNLYGYEVSNLGRIRSYRPINGKGPLKESPRLLALTGRDKDGYVQVCLRKENKDFYRRVHTYVAEAFLGCKPDDSYQVCHNNGDRTDNRVNNIRWGTAKDNSVDREKHNKTVKGVDHHGVKLTEKDIIQIRELYSTGEYFQKELARIYDVTQTTINGIVTGKQWKHVSGPVTKTGKGGRGKRSRS